MPHAADLLSMASVLEARLGWAGRIPAGQWKGRLARGGPSFLCPRRVFNRSCPVFRRELAPYPQQLLSRCRIINGKPRANQAHRRRGL